MTENDNMSDGTGFPPDESPEQFPTEGTLPPPPPARPDGGLDDAVAEGAANAGPEKEETPLTEEEKKKVALEMLGNKKATVQELVNALNMVGRPGSEAEETLRSLEQDPDKIRQVMERADELPPELSDEEKANAPEVDVDKAQEELSPLMEQLKEIEQRSHDPNAEPTDEDKGVVAKATGKFRDFLFSEDTGIWREGQRLRTVGKGAATGLLASLVILAMLLHISTKWATGRVGRSAG